MATSSSTAHKVPSRYLDEALHGEHATTYLTPFAMKKFQIYLEESQQLSVTRVSEETYSISPIYKSTRKWKVHISRGGDGPTRLHCSPCLIFHEFGMPCR
jgi:hypothetical protein